MLANLAEGCRQSLLRPRVGRCGRLVFSRTTPSMNIQVYPREGLSLSQFVFALNEELKRTAHRLSIVREFTVAPPTNTLTHLVGSP